MVLGLLKSVDWEAVVSALLMERRVQVLEFEVAELREETDSLRVELSRIRRSLAGLRAGEASRVTGSSHYNREVADGYSEDSYSVVDSVNVRPRDLPGAAPVTPTSAAPSPLPVSAVPTQETDFPIPPPTAGPLTWRQREDIADRVGEFLARCVSGVHRGRSGRDANPLQSRRWIVVRDFSGQIYTPVRMFSSWSSCKNLCKRGSDPGSSIFVGFLSERECKRAVDTAGLVGVACRGLNHDFILAAPCCEWWLSLHL